MLFKTPVATIAAVALAGRAVDTPAVHASAEARSPLGDLLHRPARCDLRRQRDEQQPEPRPASRAAAVSVHFRVDGGHARTGASSRAGAITFTTVTLLIGLCVETLAACPHYVAFFNIPSGGSRGGLKLLGDSNLDWGQDMTLLAHLATRSSRCSTSPELLRRSRSTVLRRCLAVRYVRLHLSASARRATGSRRAGDQRDESSGHLSAHRSAADIRANPPAQPLAVLGGTIYLYRLPLEDSVRN